MGQMQRVGEEERREREAERLRGREAEGKRRH